MIELIKAVSDWQKKSAKEIASEINSYPHTYHDIEITALLFLLNMRGMLVRLLRPVDTGEKWAGTLVNLIVAVNASGNEQAATAVNQFFSHVTNSRSVVFTTTNPQYCGQLIALKNTFAGVPGMPSAEDFDAFLALGGGVVNVTENEVAAVLDTIKLDERKAELQQEFAATYNEGLAVLANWDGEGDSPRLVLFEGE